MVMSDSLVATFKKGVKSRYAPHIEADQLIVVLHAVILAVAVKAGW